MGAGDGRPTGGPPGSLLAEVRLLRGDRLLSQGLFTCVNLPYSPQQRAHVDTSCAPGWNTGASKHAARSLPDSALVLGALLVRGGHRLLSMGLASAC